MKVIARSLNDVAIEAIASELDSARTANAIVFIVGIGGSAANAMHMASDLRKLCQINACAFDNVAELTARANDEGWETIFTGWLQFMGMTDVLLVLSVGGGTEKISAPIVNAIKRAKAIGATVLGIVGPNGGYTHEHADVCVRIPAPLKNVTPHTEAFQAVIWHALVSHPLLQRTATTW